MPDRSAIYHFASDNVIPGSTLTIETGTDPGDDNYRAPVLGDLNPAKVAKIDSTTFAWQADLGSSKPLYDVGLIHFDADEGANVRFQANSSASWGSPPVDLAVTIPAWLGSGTGRWPVNAWLDIAAALGSVPSYRYLRLICTGNSQDGQLGQWVVNKATRRFTEDMQWGSRSTVRKRVIENRTAFGVASIYPRGTNELIFEGEHKPLADLEDALVRQWYDVEGRTYPWLFVPDGTKNACYFVRWANPQRQSTYYAPGAYSNAFAVEEVSRGVRPGI